MLNQNEYPLHLLHSCGVTDRDTDKERETAKEAREREK